MVIAQKYSKHKWTPEEEDIVRQQYCGSHQSCRDIAAYLNGAGADPPVTQFAVQGRVTKLGIGQRENHRWSEREMIRLREWTGRYPPKEIALRLKRGVVSVTVKMKKMGLLRRAKTGWYTKKDVAEILGVDHKKVQRWMDDGYLPAVPYQEMPQKNGGGQWYIREADLRAFLLRYPQELVGRNLDICQVFDILVPAGVNGYGKPGRKPSDTHQRAQDRN